MTEAVRWKRCTRCETYKQRTFEFFYPRRERGPTAVLSKCIDCCIARSLAWNRANPDKALEHRETYRRTDAGREKLNAAARARHHAKHGVDQDYTERRRKSWRDADAKINAAKREAQP